MERPNGSRAGAEEQAVPDGRMASSLEETISNLGKGTRTVCKERMYDSKEFIIQDVPWILADETETIYSFSEAEMAYALSLSQGYRKDLWPDYARIAEVLNRDFHFGMPVRDEIAVSDKIAEHAKELRAGKSGAGYRLGRERKDV